MLPRDPSSLFAVLYRILRWYWVNFFLGTLLIFIHKRISSVRHGRNHWKTVFGWLNLSDKSGCNLVFRIYLPSRQRAMPKNGAALWIQVEKKIFLQSWSETSDPLIRSAEDAIQGKSVVESEGRLAIQCHWRQLRCRS